MLYQMKSLNFKKLQQEFLMLTEFHYQRVSENLERIDIDQEIKESMLANLTSFKKDLYEMAEYSN
jgi:hypothetical protein